MTFGVQYAGPYIDERVEHVGITRLRALNATSLRDSDKTLVIQDNDRPLAVLLPYDTFLEMQKTLLSVMATLEVFTNGTEPDRLKSGLDDITAGRVKPISEIRESLKKKAGQSK